MANSLNFWQSNQSDNGAVARRCRVCGSSNLKLFQIIVPFSTLLLTEKFFELKIAGKLLAQLSHEEYSADIKFMFFR